MLHVRWWEKGRTDADRWVLVDLDCVGGVAKSCYLQELLSTLHELFVIQSNILEVFILGTQVSKVGVISALNSTYCVLFHSDSLTAVYGE